MALNAKQKTNDGSERQDETRALDTQNETAALNTKWRTNNGSECQNETISDGSERLMGTTTLNAKLKQ